MAGRGSGRAAPRTARLREGAHGPGARVEVLPGPAVHADLAPFAAFSSSHKHRATRAVEVALGQRERFADPQTGTPEHDNHAAQAHAIWVNACGAHHGDDLLDGRRVGRVAQTLVARRSVLMKAGQRRRRAACPAQSSSSTDSMTSSLETIDASIVSLYRTGDVRFDAASGHSNRTVEGARGWWSRLPCSWGDNRVRRVDRELTCFGVGAQLSPVVRPRRPVRSVAQPMGLRHSLPMGMRQRGQISGRGRYSRQAGG